MAAVTQVRNDTPGRGYYLCKQAEGKSRKEALRALKPGISHIVYQRRIAGAQR
jgi:transposase